MFFGVAAVCLTLDRYADICYSAFADVYSLNFHVFFHATTQNSIIHQDFTGDEQKVGHNCEVEEIESMFFNFNLYNLKLESYTMHLYVVLSQ